LSPTIEATLPERPNDGQREDDKIEPKAQHAAAENEVGHDNEADARDEIVPGATEAQEPSTSTRKDQSEKSGE
jgi:hypothetical protein